MNTVHAADQAEWRAWLQENAATAGEIWLVIQHKGGAPSVQHSEAIEEALCFGWIDSLARRRGSRLRNRTRRRRSPGAR